MDKQNFYQEKYEYYRTLNLWAVFGISIPSIGYFFSDCYLLGGKWTPQITVIVDKSDDKRIQKVSSIIPFDRNNL